MTHLTQDLRRGHHPAAYYSDGRLGALTYDQIYAEQDSVGTAFYVSCAKKYGGPVLEAGAGTGRVTWAVAAAGLEIVGIDSSQPMLDVAQSKQDSQDPSIVGNISFVLADMAEFQLAQVFSTAIIPGRSFQHLVTPQSQRSALTCIHRHLRPGGTLIMNIYDPKLDYCRPGSEPPFKTQEIDVPSTGERIRRTFTSRTTDPLSQTFSETVHLEVFDAAGVRISDETTSWSLRWTYQQEMRYLFELTGFEVLEQFSDYDGAAPAYAKEQFWICRRE